MNAHQLVAGMCWAAATTVAIRGVGASVHIHASLRWLGQRRPTPSTERGRRHVLLILPMLREQSVIADTTAYFRALAKAWGPATVVLATTEREYHDRHVAEQQLPKLAETLRQRCTAAYLRRRFTGVLPAAELAALADTSGEPSADYRPWVEDLFAGIPTTPELAAKLAASSGGIVHHHHHPGREAVMVHQINAVVTAELRQLTDSGVSPDQVWIGVYNADSRPHPGTLTALAAVDGARVVQQSALFTVTDTVTGGVGRAVCDGAALLQSRWTLAREIPRLRAQAAQARTGQARWPRLAHTTGHGLFVRGDCWQQLGGLPTATMNEDLAFGYQLSAAGVPIDVLPLVEVADSPATVRALVRQHRQWFFSYPDYPGAARVAADTGCGERTSRTWLSVQGLARGVLWLGQSPALAATLALPAVTARHRMAVVAALAALASYLVVPATLITASGLPGAPTRFGLRQAAGLTSATLTSSTGPWWCLLDLVRSALAGDRLTHDKTER